MDHARHMSSPSPTSPFLFHHSERSFKSNPLTPLLSSTVIADVTNVDDCFSAATTTSSSTHQSPHNPFASIDHHHHAHHHHHHHHHHQQSHHHHLSSGHHPCVIDQDSLTGVDDDDGMHNMLSGSSTSSNSTMPLLTESHSHHSFSRISLEEYSPLSLVEDCDNALPISPTSLVACGSHHSFKSSMNGLKMDNLAGDVVGVHDHDHDHDDDMNDNRSLSPTLLSAANAANNHHNLWSTSSTAITQNTSLLNSTSSSFLLSHHHHHHHQLSSLMQQLEPQSLDEPPPLISKQHTSFDTSVSSNLAANRPSSEPPPGCGFELSSADAKSLNNQPLLSGKAVGKQSSSAKQTSDASASAISTASSSNRSRKSRSRAGANAVSRQASAAQTSNKNSAEQSKKSATSNDTTSGASSGAADQDHTQSSKFFLQLNHHKKLEELQQRLFGATANLGSQNESTKTSTNSSTTQQAVGKTKTSDSTIATSVVSEAITTATGGDTVAVAVDAIKEEPDSSAGNKEVSSESDRTTTTTTTAVALNNSNTSKRGRQIRGRKGRSVKSDTCNSSSTTTTTTTTSVESGAKSAQKTVTTETAEPDTTTKSSDCIKLADLLSNNTNDTKNSNGFVYSSRFANTSTDASGNGESGGGEKRLQQIQLQVTPSLTVVANGGLMQSIGVHPQQQQQQTPGGAVITTSGATFSNQILCRPQTVVATTGGQLKGIMSSNELLKSGGGGESVLSNWSLQTNNCTNQNGQSINAGSQNGAQTIGAHQIAIQVICQDGTSLVLPVSSAAGLNAAVSLTSQHQQLQAVLANNANQQQQRSANQLLPLMSVANIVAQQQVSNAENGSTQSTSTIQNSSTQTSGLAASSPTLAALLDAGSSRSSNNDLNGASLANQSFVSTNLLRKLVSATTNEVNKRNELTLQQGATLSLSNCGSLVTVCSTNNNGNSNNNNSSCSSQSVNKNMNGGAIGEKRIKLESSDANNNNNNNMQTTFTLIDPHGLIVANGNEKTNKQNVQTTTTTTANTNGTALAVGTTITKTNLDAAKQNKMNSNTGNRQVDPTQPFRCEHCSSTFTRLGNFTRHKKIHTVPTKDGQRFKCDVCSKSFLQRCDLARHLHIHRGTEPHRCNICGKGYIRHSDLVTHQRFHNKEKPFGCPHCSKGFCQRGDLNRHLRSIHLQMKPILCPCCNRKFAKQETLLRHLNTAHRSKPGSTTTNAVIAELPPNYNISQGDDKETTISVVTATNAAVSNNNIAQKNAPVASLQAIQETLCKVPQSVDPYTTSGLKTGINSEKESVIRTVS